MLNELEKSYLQRFVEEDGMLEAVRKAIKLGYEESLPKVGLSDSDELLGQRTRAYNTACALLDIVFMDMLKYKGRNKKLIKESNLER